MSFLGSVLGAVAGPVISGLFGSDEAEDNRAAASSTNAANAASAERINAANLALSREVQTRNEQLARETRAYNEAMQREFAQMGIRWRVEDAKAAGLHPLFALSGGGAAFAPSPQLVHGAPPRLEAAEEVAPRGSTFMSQMGQDLGRALAAQLDPVQRAERALQLELLEKQVATEDARAAYYRSQAVRESGTKGLASGTVYYGDLPEAAHVIDYPWLNDTVRAVPVDQDSTVSGDRDTAAGRTPAWRTVHAFGGEVRLPAPQVSEAMEAAGEVIAPLMTLAENVRYHRWLDPAFEFLSMGASALRRAWRRTPFWRGPSRGKSKGGHFEYDAWPREDQRFMP